MSELSEAVEVLRSGGVVACPTETLVGLLADARNPLAVERVAVIKRRASTSPIALILPDASAVTQVAEPLTDRAQRLVDRYWPGPLTLLVQALPSLSPLLVQDGKVGVRVPGPSLAADLARAFGGALTATSANFAGEPPVSSTAQLPATLRQQLDCVLEGSSPGGAPSTLVDASEQPLRVLRQGAIDLDARLL